jgi:serine protease Do
LGDEVFAAGYPAPDVLGVSVKMESGAITSRNGLEDDARKFQMNAKVGPGNSGGPLVHKSGKVVGIVQSMLNPALAQQRRLPPGINYAVKCEYLLELLKGLPEVQASLYKPAVVNDGESARKRAEKAAVLIWVYD